MRALRTLPRYLFLLTAGAAALSCGDAAGPNEGGVDSVTVSPGTDTVAVGATSTLQAVVRDGDGGEVNGRTIHWSSEDPDIATVSEDGVVTGVTPGEVEIAASTGGKSGSAVVTVVPEAVGTIEIDPQSASLVIGKTVQLTATVRDASGKALDGRPVTWTTDDEAVATVDGSGLVTGAGSGVATVTAASEGKEATASIEVHATPVASIAVTPTSLELTVGQTSRLTATVRDADGTVLTGRTVNWSSSNEDIATVSSSGLVTAHAEGTAKITASSEGKSATTDVSVVPVPANAVIISPSTAVLVAGETRQLEARVTDADGNTLTGRPISWSSNRTSVATVSSSGVVTGRSEGSATITATSDGKSGTASVTVKPVPVASVDVSPSSASLTIGETVLLRATVKDADGNTLERTVTWSSSNDDVATVASDGRVTARAQGSATITATSEGKTDFATITVGAVPVASVDVSPRSATVFIGFTTQLTATPRDANGNALSGRDVQWFSSEEAVATVSQSGVVTGKTEGRATITAVSEGKSGTATITVTKAPVASVTVSPPSASVQVGAATQLTVTLKDANGNTLTDRPVSWTSDHTDIATVDASGKVTGVGAGTATITATSEGKTGTATITVTKVPVGSVTVSPPSAQVEVGHTVQLTATVKDANGATVTDRPVTWASDHPEIATVDGTGKVTGVAPGSATITATSEGKVGSSAITVAAAPVGAVLVTPGEAAIPVYHVVQLSATVLDVNGQPLSGRTISWRSSDDAIATTSPTGTVTGVAPGMVRIIAMAEEHAGESSVTVQPPLVSAVVVDPLAATLVVGETTQLAVAVLDERGLPLLDRTVTWTTDHEDVATVSGTGLVTAVAPGGATITATSEGKSGAAGVTVNAPPPASVATVAVTPADTTVTEGDDVQLTAVPMDASGNPLPDRPVIWSSSDDEVARVNGSGRVNARKPGAATITATSESATGASSITVVAKGG